MKYYDRNFRMWEYRVSHDQLLLRSPKGQFELKNIDVAFFGVKYIDLPTTMKRIKLDNPVDDDLKRAEELLGTPVSIEHVHIIEIGQVRHIVIAALMKVFENELDLFESSLEQF